jgi:hypothetical protein
VRLVESKQIHHDAGLRGDKFDAVHLIYRVADTRIMVHIVRAYEMHVAYSMYVLRF